MAGPRIRNGNVRPRRIGTRPTARPIPLGARAVHPRLHQHLNVPRGIRLLAFEKTKNGIVVHYTKNGIKGDRVLTRGEVKQIDAKIAHINTLAKKKILRKNAGLVEKLTGLATNPQVITAVTHLLHL